MWSLPGSGREPVSPVLADGFLTTRPPGKSLINFEQSFPFTPLAPPHKHTGAICFWAKTQAGNTSCKCLCTASLGGWEKSYFNALQVWGCMNGSRKVSGGQVEWPWQGEGTESLSGVSPSLSLPQVSTVLGGRCHLFDSPSVKPSCLPSTTQNPVPCDSENSEETKIKPKKISRNISLVELLPPIPRQQHHCRVCARSARSCVFLPPAWLLQYQALSGPVYFRNVFDHKSRFKNIL